MKALGITRRSVYTTGMVARICAAAPRTVSKWIDSGLLPGYRVPGSKDRRVAHHELIKFIREHNMVVPEPLKEGYV